MSHPMQPVIRTGTVVHFKSNAIVEHLLEASRRAGIGLNELDLLPFTQEDWEQFLQLTGYTVCGYCELSMVSDESKDTAWAAAERIRLPRPAT